MTNINFSYLGSFLVLGISLSTAYAETPPPSATKEKANTSTQLPQRAGQMAYIDPATGEFTSTPPVSEIQPAPFQASPLTDLPPLQEVHHPDGSASVHLQGRFRSPVFATLDKSGKVSVKHDEHKGK